MAVGDTVTRLYSGFRGVDFRGEEINLTRSPDSINMWKDYKETDSIRTRPKLEHFDLSNQMFPELDTDKIHGIHFTRVYEEDVRIFYIHSGTNLFRIFPRPSGNLIVSKVFEDLNASKSEMFALAGECYIKDGKNYLKATGLTAFNVDGYIPTTSIACKPSGGGKQYEDVNMLTGRRKNTFLADGISTEYFLDTQNIDEDGRIKIIINGETAYTSSYDVDCVAGKITFEAPPPVPGTDGQDNVVIEFSKTIPGEREKILNCTLSQVFDNRVFFSGNPDYPNMIWHSALDNPEYVSDLDYYNEGYDASAVRGMVAGNNALWVFKEPSYENVTVFYHTPTTDLEYGKIYPNTHSSISTGCVGKAINFNDDIVFFSERGMEGISSDVTTEQVIAHRSSMVDRKLLNEPNYKNMLLEEWQGYLLVIIDNKVYLADSRGKFNNIDHMEYEWFYWELDKKITCTKLKDGVLYLGTESGVYTLTDTTSDVESYWTTPKDKFNHPQYMKTTNKRGCVSESTGDISLYVKTDKTDFELIGDYKNITDSFVSRIKRKKFKDIQLKFHSKTRFSLESVTLECFIGGYIKR